MAVWISPRRVHSAAEYPVSSSSSRFGVEVGLAGLELAGRQLDEHAAMGVAELALEQHAAVVEDRHDRHGPRVADVLARPFAAVGKAHQVALYFEEHAVVDALPRDEVLGKIFQFRGS